MSIRLTPRERPLCGPFVEKIAIATYSDNRSKLRKDNFSFAMRSWIGTYVLIIMTGCQAADEVDLSVAGRIEGVNVEVGSRVGGRVLQILVAEGDAVGKGDVVVKLETAEAESRVAAARANLSQTEAVLAKLIAGPRPEEIQHAEAAVAEAEAAYLMAVAGPRSEEIETARANASARRATVDQVRIDLQRSETLRADGAISQQDLDHARKQTEVAESMHRAALEQLDLLVRGTRDEKIAMAKAVRDRTCATRDALYKGSRKEDIDAARAARDAAVAHVAAAQVALDEMTITAPMDGIVEILDLEPGDLVGPGPVVSIIDPERLELTVYVGAAVLGFLRLGQAVDFTTDSHGDSRFPGRIVFISSDGEFTPRNLQTQEERVQQVFAVKLAFDSNGGRLRAGMSATVHLPLAENGA